MFAAPAGILFAGRWTATKRKAGIMSEATLLLGPMRVPFLILTPACVLLGVGAALMSPGDVNGVQVILVLVGALAAHISVNAFNEYFDFKSGLDLQTQRTPFSGGSGTLPQRPDKARSTLATAWIAFGVTALVGLYFTALRGVLLLPLGLAGLLLLYAYTTWMVYHPILCLVAPGIGFGTLMVMGTYFALTGHYSWTAFWASLIPFFLVSDLLLLNQFPDVEADRSTGRRHFPITIGSRRSSVIYGLFLCAAYATIILAVTAGYFPPLSLIALATLMLAVPAFRGARRYAGNNEKLLPFMAMNVIVNIATPVMVAAGMIWG
jgi:1,4-dihydroxy-2-naphthoate octaprenyltransferase